MAGESNFQILCVCTGNVCRSPAAERLLSARLGPEIEITSAGTRALVGAPMPPPMGELLTAAGGDPAGFAARQLSERLVQPADLVLALTRAHRGDVVELWPKAVRRTFTLKEFARLLGEIDLTVLPPGSPAQRLRAAVPLALAQRRHIADLRSDDVVDPYGMPPAVYQEAATDIDEAVAAIASVLRAA